ncbi:MAG: nucleoside hydrolase, partial [Planctomycetota bacterium]
MKVRSISLFVLVFVVSVMLAAAGVYGEPEESEPNKIRIILDTDANNELDDQHAIAYMLFNGDVFDVEGITVNRTSGGGGIDNHVEEAERVVRLCGLHPQVKVYKGANANYEEILPHIKEPEFDGSEAVDFIIDRANADDARELVLMPIGKLT